MSEPEIPPHRVLAAQRQRERIAKVMAAFRGGIKRYDNGVGIWPRDLLADRFKGTRIPIATWRPA